MNHTEQSIARIKPMGDLLTPAEVARRLSVSRSMVYLLIRRRELRTLYIGRLPRVSEAALDDYVERQREASERPS